MTHPPHAWAQRAASRVSARLSAPPETPTARWGADSNGPSRSRRRANSWSESGAAMGPVAAEDASAAAETLALARGGLLHRGRRLGIALVELAQGAAGLRLAVELAERHAELQHIVRRLVAAAVFLHAFGEGRRGAL